MTALQNPIPVLDRHAGPAAGTVEPTTQKAARYVFAALRIGLGFILLWAFLDKAFGLAKIWGRTALVQTAPILKSSPPRTDLASTRPGIAPNARPGRYQCSSQCRRPPHAAESAVGPLPALRTRLTQQRHGLDGQFE